MAAVLAAVLAEVLAAVVAAVFLPACVHPCPNPPPLLRPPVAPPARAGEPVLRALLESQPADAPVLYHLPHMRMWTKLRPGVREFLEQAKDR